MVVHGRSIAALNNLGALRHCFGRGRGLCFLWDAFGEVPQEIKLLPLIYYALATKCKHMLHIVFCT